VITVAICWLVTWAGLVAAYYSPYPIGFYVTTFAFAAYLTSHLLSRLRNHLPDRFGRRQSPSPGLTAEGTA
jgi:zinc/manganese transport system permease protein